jgi:hypothetical protein
VILLTEENTANAIQRNLNAPAKDTVRYMGTDLFHVICPNPHHRDPHRVRLVETLAGVKGDCDCECRRNIVCHHITSALAVFEGIKAMRHASRASRVATEASAVLVAPRSKKVERVRGFQI